MKKIQNTHCPCPENKGLAATDTVSGSGKEHFFSGCNVENACYGLTQCAERVAIANMVAQGYQKIEAVLIFVPKKQFCTPCGACRQCIAEFATEDIPIYLYNNFGEYND